MLLLLLSRWRLRLLRLRDRLLRLLLLRRHGNVTAAAVSSAGRSVMTAAAVSATAAAYESSDAAARPETARPRGNRTVQSAAGNPDRIARRRGDHVRRMRRTDPHAATAASHRCRYSDVGTTTAAAAASPDAQSVMAADATAVTTDGTDDADHPTAAALKQILRRD